MAALNAGRALLQACKQGALADVKACTARVLAIRNVKETNPPMKMAMGAAAYGGHTNSLRHLIASLPRDHWQGSSGPWDPIVVPPLDTLPQEWRAAAMADYVVYLSAVGGAPDTMQALLDSGLGLNHQIERMGSPLGIAIRFGKIDLIRFLLAKGADPNDQYAFPPISLLNQAALLRSTAIMQLLLDYGAAVEGSMALQGAAETGCIEAAALLLELGADINEVFRWNMSDRDIDVIGSALHVAVRHEQEAMVEFLLRRGARQDSLDGYGATVKALAVETGNGRIIRLLQQHEPSNPGNPL
jgi:cytochrome c551/c552